jgi:hypothetical protein
MTALDRFQIHYYLANGSHAMDAFVRNKCEAELLAILQEICAIVGASIKVETVPSKEGGLRDFWKILGDNGLHISATFTILTFVLGVINSGLSRVPVADSDKDAREKSIQELTIEEKKLSIEEKRLALEKLRKEIKEGTLNKETLESAAKAAEHNIKIQSRRSNFYKQLSNYEKVTAVGFSSLNSKSEQVILERTVPRSDFSKFILLDNSLPTETIEPATIEIVAPVLREGNYKWKGIYEDESISFSMTDADFKNSVHQELIAFQHGSCIKCVLQINRKVNEVGEVEINGYSVITVLEKSDGGIATETPQGKKHRAYKKFIEDQPDLFSGKR